MDAFLKTLKDLGVVRLAVIATVLVGMIGGFYYVTQKFSEPQMALLYAELDLADAGHIVSRIEGMGVPVEVKGGGSQIYVPSDKVARLRMDMAEAGLPRGGAVGYEIFDKSESLGTSGFVQDMNHLRALEGELARTITGLSNVASARVHLVLPRRELFSHDRQDPSASIVLRLNGPGRLKASKVQAIQHLVASAVPNLSPDRVSIVDDAGNLLARGNSSAEQITASNLDELKLSHENRIAQAVEHLVEKYVGLGKVRAEVSVDLDLDRVTENSEKYDPEGQVLRSSQVAEEGEDSADSSAGGAASVESGIPNSSGDRAGGSSVQSKKNQEIMNYEVSRSVKTHIREVGGIKRLSVAVLVDGTYKKAEDGKMTYAPRPKEEMDQLTKLIKSAIGYHEERKDTLEVVNMRFAQEDLDVPELSDGVFLGFTKGDLLRFLELLVIGLLGLLVLLMVVRPLINKLLEGALRADALPENDNLSLPQAQQMLVPQLQQLQPVAAGGASPEHSPRRMISQPMADLSSSKAGELDRMISMKQVEGQIRESSLKKIGEIIDNRTEEAVSLVRNWMYED